MIHRLRICNFKSIRDQTIEFDPVTVLVGRSGSGKSNIVQAIRFLRNYLLSSGSAVDVEGGWQRIVPVGVKEPTIQFHVEFAIDENSASYQYALQFGVTSGNTYAQQGKLQVVGESLACGGRVLFHRAVRGHKWHWESPPSAVSIPDAHLDLAIQNLPAVEEVTYAYTALSSGIGYHPFATSVMNGLHTPDAQGQKGIDQHLPGLNDHGSNYLTVLRDIARDLHQPQVRRGILASLQQLNPAIRSIELDSITQPKSAIVGHDVNGSILDIKLEQESDGLRRFYAHLLALYQRPPKLVNIFEEPENAIYPGALAILADEFKLAPNKGRGQVILTTHSPGLLDHFDVKSLRVVEMQDGQTRVGPVSREQQEAVQDRLLTTGELLTVDEPRMDQSTHVTETGSVL